MENILNRVIGECRGSNRYATIAQAATDARGQIFGICTDLLGIGNICWLKISRRLPDIPHISPDKKVALRFAPVRIWKQQKNQHSFCQIKIIRRRQAFLCVNMSIALE